MEFDGNSERGGYYEQDNFIYNDDKSGFIGHTDGKFANSFIIRGHSTTTWTKFYPMLTPSPIEWTIHTDPLCQIFSKNCLMAKLLQTKSFKFE